MKVLIAAPAHACLQEELAKKGYECIMYPGIKQEEAAEFAQDCTGIVTSTRLVIDSQLIDACPQLKWIGRLGSGMELIDVAYAQSKAIQCISSPEGNCNAVAEHALGLLLSLSKKINLSAGEVRQQIWERDRNRGFELEGKTIAVIGLGNTGTAFARKLQGFNMRILAYDVLEKNNIPPYITLCNSLQDIWDNADIISFHVPLTASTEYYFDTGFIEKCRKPIVLINTSRGNVVQTGILKENLDNGRLLAAGLDVLEQEPLPKASPLYQSIIAALLQSDKVIITPHIAGYSQESFYKMSYILAKKINSIGLE